MALGFIYIMSNPSFSDGKIKIGKSMNDPSFRKAELNTTGLPEPFEIEYFAFVEDYDTVEIIVHNKLSKYRPNKNREFFNCSIPKAILTIQQSSTVKYEEVFYKSPEEINEIKKQEEAKRQAEKEKERIEQEREKQRLEKERKELEKKQLQLEKERRERKERGIIKNSWNYLNEAPETPLKRIITGLILMTIPLILMTFFLHFFT